MENNDIVTPLVAKWVAIIGTLGTVAAIVLQTTVLDSLASQYDWVRSLILILTVLATVGGAIGGGRLAKRQVTPVANPQKLVNGKLVKLVPAAPPSEPPRAKSRIEGER